MRVNLNRINAVPLAEETFSAEFKSWVSVLVDSLNQEIGTIVTELNRVVPPSFTTVQITTLAVTAPNGEMWYDTDTNEIKAKVNGVVVVVV
jgi:hypothetical protein